MAHRRQFELLTQTKYDAIIIGTGLTESLLAAALAIAGSSVLHLDANDFYGGSWATLSLSQLQDIVTESGHGEANGQESFPVREFGVASLAAQVREALGDQVDEIPLMDLPLRMQLFPNGVRPLHVEEKLEPSQYNRFSLDVIPRPIMAAGSLVDLMIQTNVGHYIDFRALKALYVEFGGPDGLQLVPGSRAGVFQNRFISMLEKRLLMRFVKKCYDDGIDEDEQGEVEIAADVEESGQSFQDELTAMGLTAKLQTFLTQSIAFCSGQEGNVSKEEGVARVRVYQKSMAKFGTKTPFLFPNYGSGELSQAFCRLCAVHGGVYVLRRGAASIVRIQDSAHNENEILSGSERYKVGVVTTENELILGKRVFVGSRLLTGSSIGQDNCSASRGDRRVWRMIAITDRSIAREDEKRLMITVPRGVVGNENSAVRIRQLDSSVMICPSGFFVLYAETVEPSGCETDLLEAISTYADIPSYERKARANGSTNSVPSGGTEGETTGSDSMSSRAETRAQLVWGMTYPTEGCSSSHEAGQDVVVVATSTMEIDAEEPLKEAKRCFEFLHSPEQFFSTPNANPDGRRSEMNEPLENGSMQGNGDVSDDASPLPATMQAAT